MKTNLILKAPFAAVSDTVSSVKLAVSAASEYRRLAALRNAEKGGRSLLSLD